MKLSSRSRWPLGQVTSSCSKLQRLNLFPIIVFSLYIFMGMHVKTQLLLCVIKVWWIYLRKTERQPTTPSPYLKSFMTLTSHFLIWSELSCFAIIAVSSFFDCLVIILPQALQSCLSLWWLRSRGKEYIHTSCLITLMHPSEISCFNFKPTVTSMWPSSLH